MNISELEIERQWNRVKSKGWLPHFEEAAKLHGFPVHLLIAIGSRETNLSPAWLTKLGDGGHGAGLLQIDIRTDRNFVASGKWKDARAGILRGTEVLADKRLTITDGAGRQFTIRSFKGDTVRFIMPKFDEPLLTHVVVSAYNSGMWAAYHASKGRSPDRGTTGGDYGADVLERAEVFKKLMEEEA